MREPNLLAQQFSAQIRIIHESQAREQALEENIDKLHVSTTGAGLTLLYESLRNASENAEENLLLQRAIRRFFKRVYLTPDNINLQDIGEELVTELTLAGYIENDSVTMSKIEKIAEIVHDYSVARKKLLEKFPKETVERWTLEPMSVSIESQLKDHRLSLAFADLAYNYFLNSIDTKGVFSEGKPNSYEAAVFISVSSTLLKHDPAAIRFNLLTRYQVSPIKTISFAKFNAQIDKVFAEAALKKINFLIDRNGATLRILLRVMNNDAKLANHLESEKAFLGPYDSAISESYSTVGQNINRGIFRSVIFLIITKFIIGIAIEVPYDLIVHNKISWLALAVNLLIPPLYMIALRLTLLMPGANNTRALNREITHILFEPIPNKPFIGSKKSKKFGIGYNIVYSIAIASVFGGVGYLLIRYAQFEWIHLIIFFVFISTASFLGFRLSRSIREIEVGEEAQTGVTMIRDLLYMPFVVVGRSISETYAQFNIMSRFLDMFVELPLKTILGFVRQWGSFVSSKKDSF